MHKPGQSTEDMIMEQLPCQPMWLLIRPGKEILEAWKVYLGVQQEGIALYQSLPWTVTSPGIEVSDFS